MTSVRLGEELEHRVKDVARRAGRPVSEIVREAVEEYCTVKEANRPEILLRDMIGAVRIGRRLSERTGEEFAEILAEKHAEEVAGLQARLHGEDKFTECVAEEPAARWTEREAAVHGQSPE